MSQLLILFVAAAVLLMLVSLPLLCEKVPPNRFYGFRVRATLADRAVWYAVNRYAARRMIWSGFAIIGAAVVLYWVPGLSLDGYAWSCAAVALVALGTTVFQTMRYLRSLPDSKALPREENSPKKFAG